MPTSTVMWKAAAAGNDWEIVISAKNILKRKILLVIGGLYLLELLAPGGFIIYIMFLSKFEAPAELWILILVAAILILFWIKTYPLLIRHSEKPNEKFAAILDYSGPEYPPEEEPVSFSQRFAYLAIIGLLIGIIIFTLALISLVGDYFQRGGYTTWQLLIQLLLLLLGANLFLYPFMVLNYFKVKEK